MLPLRQPAGPSPGLGVGEPTRRDRLLLVSAFAVALLTLLGTVGESLGMNRLLKSDTSKPRSYSLLWQGCKLYELIPNMPEHRLAPLIEHFAEAVSDAGEFSGLFNAAEMGESVRQKGLRSRPAGISLSKG